MCASDGAVVLDLVLPGRPRRELASFGPIPRVMSVVEVLDGADSQVVVRLGQEGADMEVVDR